MRFAIAMLLLLAAAIHGEETKPKEKNEEIEKNSFAEFAKKLEELQKEVSDVRSDNQELRQEATVLRQSDEQRQKEFAALKMDNIKLREAEAQLRKADSVMRKADAELRKADAKILAANEKEAEEKEIKRQDDASRQEDVEAATRQLILQEIRKYHRTHNDTTQLKDLILSEIKKYQANADRRIIANVGGKGKWDTEDGSGYDLEGLFTKPDVAVCAGWTKVGYFTKPFPHLIWYEYASSHTPARFEFSRYTIDQGATTWRFVGAKDEGCNAASTWTEFCGDMSGETKAGITGCDVPKYLREPFKCLGIRIYSNGRNGKDNTACVQGQFKFWETGMTPV